jgi:hypothetical protein
MSSPLRAHTPRIEIRYFDGCPHVKGTRDMIRACLGRLGMDVPIEDKEGDYPSPTVLVDGVDVMGTPGGVGRVCRLDVPTETQLMAALRRA